MTTASLLKQNTHYAQILLQPEPLWKGKGKPSGEECNSQCSLYPRPDTSIRIKWNHTANLPQAEFPRQNCCEDVCLLVEAQESRAIFREYRHSFTHLLLSFCLPFPRLLALHDSQRMTMPSTSP